MVENSRGIGRRRPGPANASSAISEKTWRFSLLVSLAFLCFSGFVAQWDLLHRQPSASTFCWSAMGA
jgi:hypothetical protein